MEQERPDPNVSIIDRVLDTAQAFKNYFKATFGSLILTAALLVLLISFGRVDKQLPDLPEYFPLAIGMAAGYLLISLVLKRLEMLDHLSEALRLEQASATKEVRNDLIQKIKDLEATMHQSISQAVHENVAQVAEELRNLLEKARDLSTVLDNRYGMFLSHPAMAGVDEAVLTNAGPLHSAVERMFNEDKPTEAVRMVEAGLNKGLTGSPVDFHNLAVELARHQYFNLSWRVVQAGLKSYSDDMDLLADGIDVSSKCGDSKGSMHLADKLSSIPREHFNWRAFEFLGDYLEKMGKYDEAKRIHEDFKKFCSNDDRPYVQLAQRPGHLSRTDEVIAILEQGIKNVPRAPRCAFRLGQAYLDKGMYREAIAAFDRSIEDLSESQPPVDVAAVVWHRASAYDGLAHSLIRLRSFSSDNKKTELAKIARQCVEDYLLAMNLPSAEKNMWEKTGKVRIVLLQRALRSIGFDDALEKDSLE